MCRSNKLAEKDNFIEKEFQSDLRQSDLQVSVDVTLFMALT